MGNFHSNVFKENIGLTVEGEARLSVSSASDKSC